MWCRGEQSDSSRIFWAHDKLAYNAEPSLWNGFSLTLLAGNQVTCEFSPETTLCTSHYQANVNSSQEAAFNEDHYFLIERAGREADL